jgi:thiol:disulfide interchange protein
MKWDNIRKSRQENFMIRMTYFLSLLLVLMLACGNIPSSAPSPTQPVEEIVDRSELQNSALVDVYDPARNPANDLGQAILIAQKENKGIMLELGGDWCIWCKYMDDFYATHADILQYRADNYVLVKVNVSDENMNEEFLSQYPPAGGYPHIYILDRDGTFLHSQDTVELEDGKDSYVPEVFMTFLQKWAPPAK